jgi:hypothetical protein
LLLVWWGPAYGLLFLPPALVPVLVGVVTAGVVIAYQNRAALSGFSTLERQFRGALSADGAGESEAGKFVSFNPTDAVQFYDGFTNWDVGLLRMTPGGLAYQGDGASFVLARERVLEVRLISERHFYIPVLRVGVRWRDDDDAQTVYTFSIAGARSLCQANRATRRFCAELEAWFQEANGDRVDDAVSAPAPPPLQPKGQLLHEVYTLQQNIAGTLLVGLFGFVVGYSLGLPPAAPFAASAACVGLSAALCMLLVALPGLWAARVRQAPTE